MAATSLVAVVLFLVSFAQFQQVTSSKENCSVLYLLNVQPYPDDNDFSGFDGGLNLIPAAHLAAEEINNRSDILTGHHLEVIDIEAEACGRSVITKGLVNLYGELLNRDCIVGVMGFVCSTSTNFLAPIVELPGIAGYITLANSASPHHRNITTYPNLFHTISSASVHNTVIISLMQMFNWKRIGLVFNSETVFYRSTATDFIQRITNLPDTKLITDIALTAQPSKSDINEVFNTINSEEARISYWLGNDAQYALFLCEAYQRKFVWPGYVYILRHNPHIITNILKAKTSCNNEQILEAVEGVILLDYRLYVDDDTELFSGWNFFEFQQRYVDKLIEFTNQTDSVNLTYATSFYDQVWTFALSLNNSLQSILSRNLSFLDYTFPNTETISNIIKQELLNLSFQGASGRIRFNENHEIPSLVNIMQIQNGTVRLIAIYDPFSMNVSRNDHYPTNNIPPDTFDTVYNFLPLWIGVCIFIVQSALFCLITTNMVLLTYWRNEREIKATSYLLSMLLTSSCYLLTIGPVIQTVYRIIVIHNTTLHTVLCNVSLWSTALGLDLMLATLLFRLFRVVHIFKPFQRASKYLSADMYILLYVLLTCSVKVLILIIWSIVDPYRSQAVRKYDSTTMPPVYRATPMCYCNQLGVWYAISYLYSVILLSFVVFFAVQTRRIKITDFKDTKKINLFVFLVIITLSTAIPLVVILSEIDIQIGAVVSQWIGIFSVPLLCQVCLIVPKVVPLAVKKIQVEKGK